MVIRMGVGIWTAVMFKDVGLSAFDAGKCMAALEIGGAVGGMIGGRLSDRLLDGRRGPVMCIFSLICVPLGLALSMLLEVDGDAAYGTDKLLLLQLVYFFIGVFSFPPHSFIGLMSRELVPEKMRSTAGCIAKAVGQLGAAAAGWPLQQVAAVYGWSCKLIRAVFRHLSFPPPLLYARTRVNFGVFAPTHGDSLNMEVSLQ